MGVYLLFIIIQIQLFDKIYKKSGYIQAADWILNLHAQIRI